jgi:cell division protein ZapA
LAQVNLTINGRHYDVACDDGQEEHLMKLAAFVDDRVTNLKHSVGSLSESHLMMMAALVIADELDEALIQIEEIQENKASGTAPASNSTKPSDHGNAAGGGNQLEEKAANALEACASRLESIAIRLEGA